MREIMLDTNHASNRLNALTPGARPTAETQIEEAADDPNFTRSIKVGIILGLLVGAVSGVAMLLYVDSPKLNQWPGTPFIILLSSLGWALYGMIAGSGGVFSNLGRRTPGKVS